jgi:autotransporter-associated beta strand protein
MKQVLYSIMLFLVVSSELLATDHDEVIDGVDNSSSDAPVDGLLPSAEELEELRLLRKGRHGADRHRRHAEHRRRVMDSVDAPVADLPPSAEELRELRKLNRQRTENSSNPPVAIANTSSSTVPVGDLLPPSAEELEQLRILRNLRQRVDRERAHEEEDREEDSRNYEKDIREIRQCADARRQRGSQPEHVVSSQPNASEPSVPGTNDNTVSNPPVAIANTSSSDAPVGDLLPPSAEELRELNRHAERLFQRQRAESQRADASSNDTNDDEEPFNQELWYGDIDWNDNADSSSNDEEPFNQGLWYGDIDWNDNADSSSNNEESFSQENTGSSNPPGPTASASSSQQNANANVSNAVASSSSQPEPDNASDVASNSQPEQTENTLLAANINDLLADNTSDDENTGENETNLNAVASSRQPELNNPSDEEIGGYDDAGLAKLLRNAFGRNTGGVAADKRKSVSGSSVAEVPVNNNDDTASETSENADETRLGGEEFEFIRNPNSDDLPETEEKETDSVASSNSQHASDNRSDDTVNRQIDDAPLSPTLAFRSNDTNNTEATGLETNLLANESGAHTQGGPSNEDEVPETSSVNDNEVPEETRNLLANNDDNASDASSSDTNDENGRSSNREEEPSIVNDDGVGGGPPPPYDGDGGVGPDGGGVPNPISAPFWDGDRTIANGIILGGSGVWNNTSATWSSFDGLSKNTWNSDWAIFGGNAGIVDVRDNVSFRRMDFIADGYTIRSSNNSKLLTNGPATIGVDSTYQAEILAEITGNGSILKEGLGTLILSHDNSYIGGTVLNEGTLVANTRNALSSGPVTLQGGLLRLGNTQTLEIGSYTQNEDAILALRINSPTNCDQLVVNGSANLGGTLLLLLEGKPSNFGKQMTLITTQGLNGSQFDNIQLKLAQTSLRKLFVDYDTNNVYVASQFAPIYPYAISRNAKALARNLDLFSNSGRNEEFFNTLADLSLPQVPTALEKLVPDQVFSLSSIGLSVGRSQMRSLQGRLEDLNSGYASYGQLNASAPKQYGLPSWNFYVHGNGSFGRQKDNEANGNEVVGYDYGQGGTFIGADYHLSDKVYAGGAVSYTYTDASFHGDRGSLSTDSYFIQPYIVYAQPKGFNLLSSLSFGAHEFDLKRRALTDTAHSQPQSKETGVQSQVSYNIPLEPNFTVSPYAGLAYSAFWMDGFQEHNSQANLKIGDEQTNSLRSTVGVKAKYKKPFTKGIQKASIETTLAWEREYLDSRIRGFNAEWIGSGVPSFRVQGGRMSADRLVSGVNLRLSITNLLSVTTGYNIAASQDDVSHGFSVGVNLAF